ncbi:Putative phosphoribosyltransferase [Fulvivirga imtechensis AK7]|uniref:Putative phosphoribosyltransferase n=1 Tax=Fulvivirga imtechensis AK7 TaxID=1237149 RepID=L8JRU8_9BACT|nr:phosphoribosyltransferase family protein [Fulvivirga imtechensis]ELR71590.1 Putative phosphoribosyltransferase [Fulvivirga imtechensis AK7]
MMFHNREDAANQLIIALKQFRHENAVVLAIPRGGVPLGKKISEALHFPLDISLIKKIGHPANKEFAIGAVGLEDEFFTETERTVSRDYVDEEIDKVREKLQKRYHQYMGDRHPVSLKNKTVIIVDDGVATGSTLLATVQMVQHQDAAKIIVAVPVGAPAAIRKLRTVADDVICLETPTDFRAVGQFYENFEQVNDREVIEMLH